MAADELQGFIVVRRVWIRGMRRNLEAGVGGSESVAQVLSYAGHRSQKEKSEAAALAHRGNRFDQVRSGYRPRKRTPVASRRPDHPGPVGQTEVRGREDPRKLMVALGTHDELRIHGRHQVEATAFAGKPLDSLEGLIGVQAVDPDTKDPGLGQSGSMTRLVSITEGMLVPRLEMNSGSDSPPPTRTRPHKKRLSWLWRLDPSSITAVL